MRLTRPNLHLPVPHQKLVRVGLAGLLLVATVQLIIALCTHQLWQFRAVQTGSMAPAISRGSLVVIRPQSAANLRAGQIASYRDPYNRGVTVTHRLERIESSDGQPTSYIFKGDSNQATDLPIDDSAVIGRVVLHLPLLGKLAGFMHSWLGLLLGLYLPAMAFVFYELRRFRRQSQANKSFTTQSPSGEEKTAVPAVVASNSKPHVVVARTPAPPLAPPAPPGPRPRPLRPPQPFLPRPAFIQDVTSTVKS